MQLYVSDRPSGLVVPQRSISLAGGMCAVQWVRERGLYTIYKGFAWTHARMGPSLMFPTTWTGRVTKSKGLLLCFLCLMLVVYVEYLTFADAFLSDGMTFTLFAVLGLLAL